MASSGLDQSDEEEQRPLVGITEDAAVHVGSEELRALLKQQREEMHALKQQQQEFQNEMNEAMNALENKTNQQQEAHHEALKKQQEAHRDELRALETKTNQLEEALQAQQAAAPTNANVNRYRRGRGFSFFYNADGGGRARDNDGDGDEEEHVLEEDVFSLMMLNKYHGVCPHPFPRILQFCIRTLCILYGIYTIYPGGDLLWLLQDGWLWRVYPEFIPCIILGIIMIILPTKIARYLQPPQISILCRIIPCIYIIYYTIVILPYSYDLPVNITGMVMIVMSRKIAILSKYILCRIGMSAPWALGLVTFILFQIGLGIVIIYDQWNNTRKECYKREGSDNCVPFGIPINVGAGVTFARFAAVLLVLATQTDILTSIHTILILRNADHVPWDTVIGQEGNRTWKVWLLYILLPNLLKLMQAVVILFASFIVIIQSRSIIDLLKDSTALLFVSQSDNIMFYLVDLGYLGEDLKQKAAEVKDARWPVEEGDQEANAGENSGSVSSLGQCVKHYFNLHVFILFLLGIVMIGSLSFFVAREDDGTWMRMKYPDCNVDYPRWIGDGWCEDYPPYNSEVCGFDGGDCVPKPVDGYPGCMVHDPKLIGNGYCDRDPPYNTGACGWDGGDCPPPP